MKVKLITGAGGKLAEFKKPRFELEKYAKKHGFDFEYEQYTFNYKLSKLVQIKRNLKSSYDYIIWVDYDVRVLSDKLNILDYNLDCSDITLSTHKIEPDTLIQNIKNKFKSLVVPNTGVMIFKVNNYVREFVNDWLINTHIFYINYRLVDNAAFLNMIGKKNILDKMYKDHNKKFPEFNCVYYYSQKLLISYFPNNFNYVRNKNIYVSNLPIIFEHYAGVKKREEYLE